MSNVTIRKVRAFFHPGVQASLVSADWSGKLIHKTKRTFGATHETGVVGVFRLDHIDGLGTIHETPAFEKEDLNLDLPPVSPVVIEQWRNRGVGLSEYD